MEHHRASCKHTSVYARFDDYLLVTASGYCRGGTIAIEVPKPLHVHAGIAGRLGLHLELLELDAAVVDACSDGL